MGTQFAVDLKELVKLDVALEVHLRNNHYPPLPLSLIPVCKQIIKNINNGESDKMVKLPEGITTHRKYGKTIPSYIGAESWHLYPFCEQENEDY
jgi:hypothetical protein